jgi:hypothetical protein
VGRSEARPPMSEAVKFRAGSGDALTCPGAGLGLIGVGAGNEARPRRSDRAPREGGGAFARGWI